MVDPPPTCSATLTRTVLAVLLMVCPRHVVLDLAPVPVRNNLGMDDGGSDVADDAPALNMLYCAASALAVTIMSGAISLVFVVPLALAMETLVTNTDTISGWMGIPLAASPISPPPEWVVRIPLVGAKVTEVWTRM